MRLNSTKEIECTSRQIYSTRERITWLEYAVISTDWTATIIENEMVPLPLMMVTLVTAGPSRRVVELEILTLKLFAKSIKIEKTGPRKDVI